MLNRKEYSELLEEIKKELAEPNGNFQTLFGSSEETLKNGELIGAVALLAIDRYYARLTKLKLEHPDIF